MRDYRFDFANGTTDLVETMSVRTGYVRFYELLSGGGIDPRIRVESMGGGWGVVLRPGQGFRLPAEEAAGVVVTNISGTAKGPNQGYDVLFGWPMKGRTFDANAAADHPRIRFYEQADEFLANGKKDFTTAAGRYQETASTYDAIRRRYGIPPGFTPELQERHFEALLADSGALAHVKAGRIPQAIARARDTWASLPGAKTPQPQRSEQYVLAAYTAAGGTLA